MDEVTWQTNHGDKVVVWRSLQVHAVGLDVTDVEVWYWHVVARNGRVLEQGEGHTRRREAVTAALRHHSRVDEP